MSGAYFCARPQDLRLPGGPPWKDYDVIVANFDMDPLAIKDACSHPNVVVLADLNPGGILKPRDDGQPRTGIHGWLLGEVARKGWTKTLWLAGNEPQEWFPGMWAIQFTREMRSVRLAQALMTARKPGWNGFRIDDVQTNLADQYIDRFALNMGPAERRTLAGQYRAFVAGLIEDMRKTLPPEFLFVANVNAPMSAFVQRLPIHGIQMEEMFPHLRSMFDEEVNTRYVRHLCCSWEWDSSACPRGYLRRRHGR